MKNNEHQTGQSRHGHAHVHCRTCKPPWEKITREIKQREEIETGLLAEYKGRKRRCVRRIDPSKTEP
jgi:hypothetical protein